MPALAKLLPSLLSPSPVLLASSRAQPPRAALLTASVPISVPPPAKQLVEILLGASSAPSSTFATPRPRCRFPEHPACCCYAPLCYCCPTSTHSRCCRCHLATPCRSSAFLLVLCTCVSCHTARHTARHRSNPVGVVYLCVVLTEPCLYLFMSTSCRAAPELPHHLLPACCVARRAQATTVGIAPLPAAHASSSKPRYSWPRHRTSSCSTVVPHQASSAKRRCIPVDLVFCSLRVASEGRR